MTIAEPQFRRMRIEQLAPASYNPRTISETALRGLTKSLQRFGLVEPIVWNERTGRVVGGHQRLKVLQASGAADTVVVVVDLPDSQERALNVALNNPAISGMFDDDRLQPLLDDVRAADAELFTDLRLDELLSKRARQDAPGESDEVPEPPRDPVSRAGDAWLLGEHRLVCGDSREDGIARACGDDRIAIAFTSPPYAQQRKYDESSGFRPVRPDEYVAWFAPVAARVANVLADDGSWFVNIKAHVEEGQRSLYVLELVLAHVRVWGWRFIDELSWVHAGLPGAWPDRFKNQFEPIFHFARGRAIKFRPDNVRHASARAFEYKGKLEPASTGNPISWSGADVDWHEGTALPGNTLSLIGNFGDARSESCRHEAAFPVALPRFFIDAFTDAGDVVLDPFCGSGTTLIAAEQAGRRCCAVELSPAYCDVIVERWQNLTGGQARRAA